MSGQAAHAGFAVGHGRHRVVTPTANWNSETTGITGDPYGVPGIAGGSVWWSATARARGGAMPLPAAGWRIRRPRARSAGLYGRSSPAAAGELWAGGEDGGLAPHWQPHRQRHLAVRSKCSPGITIWHRLRGRRGLRGWVSVAMPQCAKTAAAVRAGRPRSNTPPSGKTMGRDDAL